MQDPLAHSAPPPNCVPLRVLGLWLGSWFHVPGQEALLGLQERVWEAWWLWPSQL